MCATRSPPTQLHLQFSNARQNETTRAEIQNLISTQNVPELEKLLGSNIQFGTAGLRARMQAGFSRLNDLTILLATQGLASYLHLHSSSPSIIIGHDHRHNSQRFAHLAAAAMITAGVRVHLYRDLVHTPLVPFAVKALQASAGIMITASHNPKDDNGYKVYWGNGSQIVPPHDAGIAAEIAKQEAVRTWDVTIAESAEEIAESVVDGYFAAVANLLGKLDLKEKFVYTPMHGVGLIPMRRICAEAGIESLMAVVPEQAHPDPDFPTVSFPNPEENGALDLAIATARAQNIRYILASDPDADRFAFAYLPPSPAPPRILSGNELGILFATHMHTLHPTAPMLCSTVSSQFLAHYAAANNFPFEETLTGFKWLGTRAQEIGACYAFEEAIGYMFSSVVFDKDGIAAAGVFLRMLATRADTPIDWLNALGEKYGWYASGGGYYVSPSPLITKNVFTAIRGEGKRGPGIVGGRKVVWWRDLTLGWDSREEGGVPRLPVSKESEMVTVELEGGVRFTVRGSGTEPKVKVYIEVRGETMEAARRVVEEVKADLRREWFRPEATGLVPSA